MQTKITDRHYPNPSLLEEQVFLLSDGPAMVGKSYSRLLQLISKGMWVDGKKVFLEWCYYEGARMATSVEAYQRFLINLNSTPFDS